MSATSAPRIPCLVQLLTLTRIACRADWVAPPAICPFKLAPSLQAMSDKLAPSERHTVTLQDRPIYQWHQTLTSVDMFVPIPPGVKAKQLFVDIAKNNIKFGINPNPPYMDAALYSDVLVSECTWLIEDGELHIYLQKATQGEHWKGAIAGHELSEENSEEDRKRILLERLQLEHPGMDFSGAEMGGSVPDASTFMGGFSKQ